MGGILYPGKGAIAWVVAWFLWLQSALLISVGLFLIRSAPCLGKEGVGVGSWIGCSLCAFVVAALISRFAQGMDVVVDLVWLRVVGLVALRPCLLGFIVVVDCWALYPGKESGCEWLVIAACSAVNCLTLVAMSLLG